MLSKDEIEQVRTKLEAEGLSDLTPYLKPEEENCQD